MIVIRTTTMATTTMRMRISLSSPYSRTVRYISSPLLSKITSTSKSTNETPNPTPIQSNPTSMLSNPTPMLCYATLCYATLCYTMLPYAILSCMHSFTMSCLVSIMLFYVVLFACLVLSSWHSQCIHSKLVEHQPRFKKKIENQRKFTSPNVRESTRMLNRLNGTRIRLTFCLFR